MSGNNFSYLDDTGFSVAVFNTKYYIVPDFIKYYDEDIISSSRMVFAIREYNESYWMIPMISQLKKSNPHFPESMLSGDTYHTLEMKKALKQHVDSLKKHAASLDKKVYKKFVALAAATEYSDLGLAYKLASDLDDEQLESFIMIVANYNEPIFDYTWVVDQVKLPKIFREGFI